MAVDYGLKVMQEGADITDTDIRNILMSSKYSMLKFHSDQTDSVTVNAGDEEQYVEFSHSLGYVPAFIAYYKFDNKIYFIPNVPRSGDFPNYGYAWADSTKVRCGIVFPTPYNQLVRDTYDTAYTTWTGGHNGYVIAGKVLTSSTDGGVEYDNIGSEVGDSITLPQGSTISSATLDFFIKDKGSGGNPNIITYGIDVDDCSQFGSDMGQAQTSASSAQTVAAPDESFVGISVTSQVQEIVNRGGWANGNNMGFYILNNGSADSAYINNFDFTNLGVIKLVIVKSGTATAEFRCIIFKDKLA